MIKSTELRIGNAVLNPSNNQVCFISSMDISDIENRYKERNPIPLTPEVLEKCGFVYETKEKNHFVKDQSNQLYISIYLGDGDYQPQICDDGIMSITLKRILYLHQLQNLYFALISEELQYQP